MPAKSHEYGIESDFQGGTGCPAGDTCDRDFRKDARAAWVADVGEEVATQYDFVFFLSAGQDESSTWQEFGQMKFNTMNDVTDDWGPPDPALPNWNKTRYVDWTSWQASSNIWPNASSGTLHPGGELRYEHVRPRVQPHPGHRRQLQQPVLGSRRAATTPARGTC